MNAIELYRNLLLTSGKLAVKAREVEEVIQAYRQGR